MRDRSRDPVRRLDDDACWWPEGEHKPMLLPSFAAEIAVTWTIP